MIINLLLVVLATTTGGQTTAPPSKLLSAAAFATAPSAEKRATLNALAAHRVSSPPEEVAYLIEAGLLDPNDDVRLSAIYAAAGRAAGARFALDKRFIDTWNAERPILIRLRPLVIKTLADANSRVRQGAIIALGNMDYESAMPGRPIRLRDDSVSAFIERLNVENDAAVRIELAKSVALTQPDPRTQDRLLSLLEDRQVDVITFAVMGVGASKVPEGLPRLIRLLRHPERAVRLQVGQALAAYESASVPYIGEIEQALAAEQDDIVKKTLAGTLLVVRKATAAGK